jgi:hypothetical protein
MVGTSQTLLLQVSFYIISSAIGSFSPAIYLRTSGRLLKVKVAAGLDLVALMHVIGLDQ